MVHGIRKRSKNKLCVQTKCDVFRLSPCDGKPSSLKNLKEIVMKLIVSSIGNWIVPVIAVLVLPGVGLSEDKASPNVESSVTVTFPSDAVQMKVPDSYTVRTAPDDHF